MSLSGKQILNSYRRAEPVIKKWGENDGFVRVGSNGPGEGWYEYPNGYDGNIRRPRVLATTGKLTEDYKKLVLNAARERENDEGEKHKPRCVYSTLNFLNPEAGFVQEKKSSQVWRKENEGDERVLGNPLPEYSDIEFMALFSDVDLESKYKPERGEERVKKTTEKAIKVYVREFEKLAPNSINVLDSGGGFYPYVHHDVTKPIGTEFRKEVRGRIFDGLTDRFNKKLEEIWETVKKEVPESEEILDPDMVNNKNRLMKVPLSIHKKLDIVVHPIDPKNPDFDPEPAPVTGKLVQQTEKWLDNQNRDREDIETLVSELWPEYEGSWKERLQQWYEEDKKKRERREKERLKHKREMEERREKLGEKGETIRGSPVTNCFEDILATIQTIDVRDMVTPYITDERDGQAPRFDPPWRSSETGTSCFATNEKFVDINEGNTGGGPVKFVAREAGLISSCNEKLEGEKWWQAIDLLRQEYGYKVPILIPDVDTEIPDEEGETHDQTPHWALIKAGLAFGIITEDDLFEKEGENENGETETVEFFPIARKPGKYNKILRELETRGFEHGRDKRYFKLAGEDRTKFVPKLLGDDILADYHFATMEESGELYVYRNGVYQRKGETTVGEEAQNRLEDDSQNQRVKETKGYIKRATYRPMEDFGVGEKLIGVENGILNLETRELEDFDPSLLIMTKIPVKYDPEAECPKIKKFVKDLVAGGRDVKKIQEMIGYTLLRKNPLNKAFMGLGPGENGRSTLFDLIHDFIGNENTAAVDLAALIYDKFASADLFGKLGNFCADISNKKIKHSGRFKKLVGEDQTRAQHKNQDAFHFKCYATPWFSANELPETTDKTRSFYRRWTIVNFPYTFTADEKEKEKEGFKEKDPNLPDPLKTDEEFSGLLNWALDGLDRVLNEKRFTGERSIKEKRELWEKESDPVREFLDEWCIEATNYEIPKEVVRQVYYKFCKENDYNVLSPGPLTKKLKSHGINDSRPRTDEHGRVHCYRGFTLRQDIVKEKGLVQVVQPFINLLWQCEEEKIEDFLPENSEEKKSTLDHLDHPDQKNNGVLQKDKKEHGQAGHPRPRETGFYRESNRDQKEKIDAMLDILHDEVGVREKIDVSALRQMAVEEGVASGGPGGFFPEFLQRAQRDMGIICVDDGTVEVIA